MSRLYPFSLFVLILTFTVILLGAYTRLMDAGLGCPDWPGCYGHFFVPQTLDAITKANATYSIPLDATKAWTEMIHRYFAQTLGIFIFLLCTWAYLKRRILGLPAWLPFLLSGLVIFQGLLGMWTVTLRLFPVVVLLHLLGGFFTLTLVWTICLYAKWGSVPTFNQPLIGERKLRYLAFFTLLMVIIQIALGGWTSANYAALICPDFPYCQGKWWPTFSFANAFQFNVTDNQSRIAVHYLHRLGALIVLGIGISLIIALWQQTKKKSSWAKVLSFYAMLLGGLFCLQISLGIANILFLLPISIAVAHNGIAAFLLLTLIALNLKLSIGNQYE